METNNFDWGGGILFLVILVIALAITSKGYSNYYCKHSSVNCEVRK